MARFIAGFAIGAVLSFSTAAYAASIVGSNGWLMGWDVTYGGETICTSPYVWTSVREIECD